METTLSITGASCTNSLWAGGCLVCTTPCSELRGLLCSQVSCWNGTECWGQRQNFQSIFSKLVSSLSCTSLGGLGKADSFLSTTRWCLQPRQFLWEGAPWQLGLNAWMDAAVDPWRCETEAGMLHAGDFVAINLEKQQPRGLWRGCWLVECRAVSKRSEEDISGHHSRPHQRG